MKKLLCLIVTSLTVASITFSARAATGVRVDVLRQSVKPARVVFGTGFMVEGTDRSLVIISCTQQYFPTTTTLSFSLQKSEEGGVEDSRIKLNQVVSGYEECKATIAKIYEKLKAGADSLTVQKSADALVLL